MYTGVARMCQRGMAPHTHELEHCHNYNDDDNDRHSDDNDDDNDDDG